VQEERWASRGPDNVFPGTSHLLLQNEIPMESTLYALNNSDNVTIIFNPSPLPTFDQIDSFPWHKVDWLLANEGEALDLYDALVRKDRDKGTPGTPSPMHELIAIQVMVALAAKILRR
jgi:ribokinase